MELAHWNHHLNPHFIGVIFKYCLIEECPLNFVIWLSILCSGLFWNPTWNASLMRSMICSVFICFILFCVVNKVKILQDFLVSCSREDIVNANVTYEMIKMRIHWYAWQLVYRQYVIDTNESFHFLDTGKKVFSVLL